MTTPSNCNPCGGCNGHGMVGGLLPGGGGYDCHECPICKGTGEEQRSIPLPAASIEGMDDMAEYADAERRRMQE